MSGTRSLERIRLVVLDWAGTAVDFGCFAPVQPFVEALRRKGITITAEQARVPMGLAKRDHLEALFKLPDVAAQWRSRYGRDWTQADVETSYNDDFMPLQMEYVVSCSRVVPGVIESVEALHQRGIKIGTTTGYFREAADLALKTAHEQGYVPDNTVIPADVPVGRPAPWMIYRNMQALNVFPPAAVLKVGDTVFDIQEGLNAGAWSAGVVDSSSDVGLTEAAFAELTDAERHRRTSPVAKRLRDAGAHEIIRTVAELPALVDRIDARLQAGEKP